MIGASATQPIPVMAQLAWAASASDAEMSQRRGELANQNLGLVVTSSEPAIETTDHFHVTGTASFETLRRVAQAAEAQMKIVRSFVQDDVGEAYFHGRATIIVLPRRYDYSEFAKMVEGRDVPPDWTSHWKFDGIDAYVVVVAIDRDDDETISNRLIAPLVALAVSTRGSGIPRWFAQGVGDTVASRVAPPSDRDEIDRRRALTVEAIAATENAKRFTDRKLTPEQSDRVGAAILSSMMGRSKRKSFDKLMRHLADGEAFEHAFRQAFGVPVASYIDNWLKYVRPA